jgi:hypothetical protein
MKASVINVNSLSFLVLRGRHCIPSKQTDIWIGCLFKKCSEAQYHRLSLSFAHSMGKAFNKLQYTITVVDGASTRLLEKSTSSLL